MAEIQQKVNKYYQQKNRGVKVEKQREEGEEQERYQSRQKQLSPQQQTLFQDALSLLPDFKTHEVM